MPPITARKPKDALGQALDPTRLYEPLSPHALGHRVYNPDTARLPSDHEAVQHAPHRWMPCDLSSEVKVATRAASMGAALAPPDVHVPDPSAPRILNPIPAERRRRALRNYHDKAGTIVHEGSLWDARDPFVVANADMFGPDEAA